LALNYLSFVLAASALGPWLLRAQRVDVVFVYAPSPILQAIAGVVLARIKRAAVVTWVQDLWPESLAITGFVRSRYALAVVRSVVRWIYQKNDLLLAQSHAFVESIRSLAGDTQVVYHPNPGEPSYDIPPTSEPPLVLERAFNVVFAGNLGTVQALDTVLDAAQLLLNAPDVRIVLIGSGSRSEWLMSQVASRNLHNVQVVGRFSTEAMPSILAQASALLVSLARSPALSQTVPAKVQAYLAAAKPVIASMDGEGAQIVREAGAGIACPAEDPSALAEAIRTLSLCPPDALRAYGASARSYYERHFHPTLLAQRLVGHFDGLVRGGLTAGHAIGPRD